MRMHEDVSICVLSVALNALISMFLTWLKLRRIERIGQLTTFSRDLEMCIFHEKPYNLLTPLFEYRK